MIYSHRIRVLGREITVKSSASPDHVREVETFVNRKLAEAELSVKSGDHQLIAILALMNVAESCLTLSREAEEGKVFDREKVFRLMQRIDNSLV